MRVKVVQGGWYGEGRVDGMYAVLVVNPDLTPKWIETDLGVVPCPTSNSVKDNVLFLRVPESGAFKIAGQSQKGLGNWVWGNNGLPVWKNTGYSYGVNPVIWDSDGMLWESHPVDGSQGYRYQEILTITMRTGDETINDRTVLAKAYGITNLWEWTKQGNVIVGQGDPPLGTHVLYQGIRYLLEPGNSAAIRFTRIGDDCCVTINKPDERVTKIFWFNVGEINTLPRVMPPNPPPLDPPKPPEVKPMNTPAVTVDLFAFNPTNHLPDGEWIHFHDPNNPNGAVVRVWVEGGSMRMSLTYQGGETGATGARRPVR